MIIGEIAPVKKFVAIVAVTAAAGAVLSACSGSSSSNESTSNNGAATSTPPAMAQSGTPMGKSALPIPLNKLKSQTVAAGDAKAGKAVFDANCASCHGAGGVSHNGPGPTLAGAGLKAGQVAFMVRHPQAIDPDSGMPALPLTDKQLADVAAYVASLK